jgi:hypothetical protein
MKRIIINNQTNDLDDLQATLFVADVIDLGKISNDGKQYCYATRLKKWEKEYMVYAHLNKKSHRFDICNVNSER